MGSGSRGPLLLATADRFRGTETALLDPRALKKLPIKFAEKRLLHHYDKGCASRVSGCGRLFTSYRQDGTPDHTLTLLQGKTVKAVPIGRFEQHLTGHITPSPDGRFICNALGLFDAEGKCIGKADHGGKSYALPPAEGGGYYLTVELPERPKFKTEAPRGTLRLHLAGDAAPVAVLKSVELPTGISLLGKEKFGTDKRVTFVPSAKLLVVLLEPNNSLDLYKVDPEALVEKSGRNYLMVTSRPVDQAVKGATYRYKPVVRSKKGGVKLKLDSGPEGMKLTAAGELVWEVPREFAEAEAGVIVTITDASDRELFHNFRIAVKGKDD
jgi:hypothetical protein